MRIGKYRISLGRTFFIQSLEDLLVWHFFGLWITKEISPLDIDKKQQFPLGTTMTYKGVRYYYGKLAAPLKKDELIKED